MKIAMALILLQFYGGGCDFGGIGADDDDDFGTTVFVAPPFTPPVPPPEDALPTTATIVRSAEFQFQEHHWTNIIQWERRFFGTRLLVEGSLTFDASPKGTVLWSYDGCGVEMIIVEPPFDRPLTCTEETDP